MKQLFFFIIFMSTIACQKQEVDCDHVRSKCTYIQFNFTDCTPNGSELGWKYDQIHSDTIVFETKGCADELNREFIQSQERVLNDPNTPVNLKKFMEIYPSTCNCE
jgi:hypothetical protein